MRRRVCAWAVLVLAAGGIAAGAPAGVSAAPACVNLRATPDLRAKLRVAHHNRDGAIAKGSVYYGRCGSTHYAIASFSKALADQPEKFRKLAGRGWVDKGDGFENGCDAGARRPIPKALVRLWGVCRSF
jgi:hypothetical protein